MISWLFKCRKIEKKLDEEIRLRRNRDLGKAKQETIKICDNLLRAEGINGGNLRLFMSYFFTMETKDRKDYPYLYDYETMAKDIVQRPKGLWRKLWIRISQS